MKAAQENVEYQEFDLVDEQATIALGAALGAAVLTMRGETAAVPSRAACIYLEGELGAGKTTLSRGLMHSLGHVGAVKSPTYTLVEPYQLEVGDVTHFDLYRLADPAELEFLGMQDYFEQSLLCLVEWPDRGAGFLPAADLRLQLVYQEVGEIFARQGMLRSHSERGKQILANLHATSALNSS